MNYSVQILRRAQKELTKLQRSDDERIRDAIAGLANDPRPPGCKKLIDREGWRICRGDFRILGDISDAARSVTVLHIGHQKNVY